MSSWKRLAEAIGLKEINWNSVNKQKSIQRYGTQDRRTNLGPTPYFNARGTGSAQRQQTAANATPDMTPRPGGLQIPNGTDRPGQLNPLYGLPQKQQTTMAQKPKSPLITAPNSPQAFDNSDDNQDQNQ